MNTRPLSTQRGFTLLEALIALVVMAFGMLALAGMQITMSRSGDIAKQRTEAVRLAQRQLDELRAYSTIAVAASHPIAWDTLAGTSTTATTNATYTIATAIASNASAPMRPINVTVTWNDRAGQPQTVTLSSVIARTDPVDVGMITNPMPQNQPLKRPKNRNINIPIPAKDLGGGYSSTQFNDRYLIVYSNTSGGVVEICDPNKTNATEAEINALRQTNRCDTVNGYIIAGYIGRAGSEPWPTGISAAIVRTNPVPSKQIQCLLDDATDQNTGLVIANRKYYICVVPLDSPYEYSGTIRLKGMNTLGNTIACRYQYTQANLDANEKNIQPYNTVTKSLDQQNYMLATSSSATCPASMTVSGISTGVLHQDCRLSNVLQHGLVCPSS